MAGGGPMASRAVALQRATLAAAAAMVVGAFLPWARLQVLITLTVNGTDGDGWFFVVGGLLAVGCAFRTTRATSVISVVLGALLVLAGVYDHQNIRSVAGEPETFALVSVGAGLYLCIAGAIGWTVLGALQLSFLRQTPAVVVSPGPEAGPADGG